MSELEIDINEIELGDELGHGQFGCVYKGKWRGQDVAVKQIYNRNEEEYDVNLYFGREVDILRYIKHPHCVRFLGFATSGDLYLVTELVKGGDLRKYLKANNMSWPDRVRVAIQIASALAYLHRNRFIHRDVKTENVLLDENGDAKLCDFGFSRTNNDEASKGMTFCGSEWFEAPEIMFCVDYDERIDVFSYGVILCELMSREVPSASVFRRVVPGFGIDPGEIAQRAEDGVPADLIAAAARCTAAEPDDRPDLADVVERLKVLYKEMTGNEYQDKSDKAVDFVQVLPEMAEDSEPPTPTTPLTTPLEAPSSATAPAPAAAPQATSTTATARSLLAVGESVSSGGPPSASLSREDLLAWRNFIVKFRSSIKSRDIQLSRRLGRVKTYINSFTGRDAVDWLVREQGFMRGDAVRLGQILITVNVMRSSLNPGAGNKATFKDSAMELYRFSDAGIYFRDDKPGSPVKK